MPLRSEETAERPRTPMILIRVSQFLISSLPSHPPRPLPRLPPPAPSLPRCLASSIRSHFDVIKELLGSLVGR